MGEFLDYIKKEHEKTFGTPLIQKGYKKQKPKYRQLDCDSISEITDLSEEGILTSSLAELSTPSANGLKSTLTRCSFCTRLSAVSTPVENTAKSPQKK